MEVKNFNWKSLLYLVSYKSSQNIAMAGTVRLCGCCELLPHSWPLGHAVIRAEVLSSVVWREENLLSRSVSISLNVTAM